MPPIELDEQFRTIVDTTPECVKIVGQDGTLLLMNAAGLRMIAAPSDGSVIGKSVYNLIAPEHRDKFREFNERICQGEKRSLEFDIIDLNGQRHHMESHAAPMRHPDGTTVQLAITHDVTERNRANRAALLLSAIVDSSDDAIISKNLDGTITSWNKAAQRLFGYTAEETVGRPITILIPPNRLDEEPLILSRLKQGERVDHFETIRRRKDGALLNISLTISPVKDANGTIIGASKIARDITERKRNQAALLDSEARFRQLADAMPQIVWTAKPDGYLDYYNQRWYDFSGFSPDTFGEASWAPLVHPDDLKRIAEVWYAAVQSGTLFQSEFRFWDRQNECWRWFIGRALPARDAEGKIVRWYGSCTDIDEQKRVETDLRRANQDLEQFAFSASHDLQEPLRSVKIYSELLMNGYGDKLDGEAIEFLSFLRAGATRMEMLVNDLLAYTKLANFEQPVEVTDANEALATALANLAGLITENGALIKAEALPSLPVHPAHLQQLLQNVIGNAVKYRSPERSPLVHVSATEENERWLFAIKDNGIGIDSAYKERIFGLFKRLHTNDEYSGTGIGLAICQRIVERYHGRIWVESEPGVGSTFKFTLPI